MKKLWDELATWSQATFGSDIERGPKGPLLHLQLEVTEALGELDSMRVRALHIELADCFLLVLDSARRAGMSRQDFFDVVRSKLQENEAREWPESSALASGVVIRHVERSE